MAVATADSPKPRIVQRLEAQRERHRQRGFLVRMLYTIVGFTVLIAGLLMLVLPGPALIVIPIGLALLSLEFVVGRGPARARARARRERQAQGAGDDDDAAGRHARSPSRSASPALVVWGDPRRHPAAAVLKRCRRSKVPAASRRTRNLTQPMGDRAAAALRVRSAGGPTARAARPVRRAARRERRAAGPR